MRVIRHALKKPDGTREELEAHFGCGAEQLVMVGDRYMTDILYGSRLGLLTVRTAPLTPHGEPAAVRLARALEEDLVKGAEQRGEGGQRGVRNLMCARLGKKEWSRRRRLFRTVSHRDVPLCFFLNPTLQASSRWVTRW
jgi:hypothetical protein